MGWPFPPPGDLPEPGVEPRSPALAGGFFTTGPRGKPQGALEGPPSQELSGPKVCRTEMERSYFFKKCFILYWGIADSQTMLC